MPSSMSDLADHDVDNGDIVRSTLALSLTPVRLAISPSRARLNWRLDIENQGEAHIVGLRIWSDAVCARSASTDAGALAGPVLIDARLHQIKMLAPGETGNVAGEWDIAREGFTPYLGSATQILPMARFRFVGAGLVPSKRAFLVGLKPMQDDAPLEPLDCDGALQIYSNLLAQEV